MLNHALFPMVFCIVAGFCVPVSAGIIVTEGDVTGNSESEGDERDARRSSEDGAGSPGLNEHDDDATSESFIDPDGEASSDDVSLDNLNVDLTDRGYSCRDLGGGVEYCEEVRHQKAGAPQHAASDEGQGGAMGSGCSGGQGNSAPWLLALSLVVLCLRRWRNLAELR